MNHIDACLRRINHQGWTDEPFQPFDAPGYQPSRFPWERAANYEKEERPIRLVRKIVVKGAVDIVFFRSRSAHLIVAGENQDAIGSIKT